MSGSPAAFRDYEALLRMKAPGALPPPGAAARAWLLSGTRRRLPRHVHVLSRLRYLQPNSVFNGI